MVKELSNTDDMKKNSGSTKTNDEDVKIKQRNLPHLTLKGSTYFITFRTILQKTGIPTQLSVDEQKLVLNHIKEGNGKYYNLIASIVLPDHVHLILRPSKGYNLSSIMKGIKGVSARKINLMRRATDRNVCSTGNDTKVGQACLSDRLDERDETDRNVCPTDVEKRVGQTFLSDSKRAVNETGKTASPTRKSSIWQVESFDRIIRDQKELDEKLNYMLNNSLKRELTDDPFNYYGWYFNDK